MQVIAFGGVFPVGKLADDLVDVSGSTESTPRWIGPSVGAAFFLAMPAAEVVLKAGYKLQVEAIRDVK